MRRLKTVSLILLTLFFTFGCAAKIEPAIVRGGEQAVARDEWRRYQGAWFSIDYPDGFIAKPSLAAELEGSFDSVFFSAREDGVSFYVLSPQWRRAAPEIVFKPAQEIQLDFTEQTDEGLIKRSTLIRARDGLYERLIESFVSPDQTVGWTFQFIYSSQRMKTKYAPLYNRFKASLEQFAD